MTKLQTDDLSGFLAYHSLNCDAFGLLVLCTSNSIIHCPSSSSFTKSGNSPQKLPNVVEFMYGLVR